MEIIRKPCANYYPNRFGYKPLAICKHISAGTMGSMDNWFASSNNKKASAHLGISRKGEIHQYVDIEHGAWTQGITKDAIQFATAPIVQAMGVNPNYYFIGVEHEGYEGNGIDGDLTEEQFLASCWLDKYLQRQVELKWGHHIELNSYNVVGHFQIDPRRKPYCPGKNYPWTRLRIENAIAEGMALEEYEERIAYLQGDASRRSVAYAIAERVQDLGSKLTDEKWGAAASTKLSWLYPVIQEVGGTETPQGVVERVMSLYKTALGAGTYSPEGVRKLLMFEPVMREKGLLP